MNIHSLRFQLTAWYASLVSGVFVVIGVLMVAGISHHLEKNLAENQLRRARQIADTLLVNVKKTGEPYVITEIQALYAPESNDRFIRITREDGSVLYVSGPPRDQSFQPEAVPPFSPALGSVSSRKQAVAGGKDLLIGALNFRAPDGRGFLVEVGAATTSIKSMLERLRLQLLLGLPLVVVVAITGGYVLIRRALAPVDQISQKAAQITQHNLSERLPIARTADELQRLSISLNRMIARLEDAFLNSKRFVADASHELRTPLTVMRGELESLAQDERLAPDLREPIGSVLEEVERLAKIVEGLLAISRLDAGEAQAEWVRFDLAELATTTADQMNLLAEDKKIAISSAVSGSVLVQGDRARLKQVIVNLLDNAIKYTPEKGSVGISVTAVNGHAVLEVTDTGTGIPAEALPHVFERFFRVDQGRSRDLGGAGLGLSIVKSICTAHGGEVQAYSTVGQGSRFRVELPLSPPPTAEGSEPPKRDTNPLMNMETEDQSHEPVLQEPGPPQAPETGLQSPHSPTEAPPTTLVMPRLRGWQRLDWRIVGVLLLASVSVPVWRATTSHAKAQRPPVRPALPVVAVARVERADIYSEVTIPAEFRPFVEVDLHAKVSGYVLEINVDFGDQVKAGQLLATLEVPELQDELNRALATQQRAEADHADADQLYTRLLKVDKQNPNLVAQQELDTAEAKDHITEAATAAAKADVEKDRTLLAYTRIMAPFDGVITHRYADPGALIQSGTSSQTQSLPLVRVSDTYRLRLDFPVPVRNVKDIQLGDAVVVRVESLGGKSFTGTISRFTHKVDDDTRTMMTEIEVPNPELELMPGMYARAVLKVQKRPQVLTIPTEAVSSDKKATVYVINQQGVIEERPVTLGLETPTQYEVKDGLNEGEVVMIGTRSEVKPGEKVEARMANSLAQQ